MIIKQPTLTEIIAKEAAEFRRQLRLTADVFWKDAFVPTAVAFRGRTDTVTLNSTTWTYAQGTAFNVALNTNFRLRILVQETGNLGASVSSNVLQYDRNNSGTFTNIGTTAHVIRSLSSQFANDETMNEQLTGGTGALAFARGYESSGTSTLTVNALEHFELEFNLQLSSANGAVNGDTFTFRFSSGGGTTLPTTVVTAGSGATFTPSQAAYRFAEDGTESGATLIGSLNTALSRDLT